MRTISHMQFYREFIAQIDKADKLFGVRLHDTAEEAAIRAEVDAARRAKFHADKAARNARLARFNVKS